MNAAVVTRFVLIAFILFTCCSVEPLCAELPRRINAWLVAGPFPCANDAALGTDYLGGETAAAPQSGAAAGGRTWQPMDDRVYCRNQDDYIDFSTWFLPSRPGAPAGGNQQVLAYAHAYVWSPAAQALKLRFGAADGARVWLNGGLVAYVPMTDRQPLRDQFVYDVNLQEGWNRLLVKVGNRARIWGFYAGLTDAAGAPVTGLEYAVDAPAGALAITTSQLPDGYTGWPYRWLTLDAAAPHPSVPSASPVRMLAKGGTPPYRWSVTAGALPPGLSLAQGEGELLGTCDEHPGDYTFTLRLQDSLGASIERELTLRVATRPTLWMEQEKIGGLLHGSLDDPQHAHGPPLLQAQDMQRQGYAYAAQTGGWFSDLAQQTFAYTRYPEHQQAFEAHGIRFGSYVHLMDRLASILPNEDYTSWSRFLDIQHRYFEEWPREARPAVLWMDAAFFGAPHTALDYDDPANPGFDFDALYSMAKTVSPETLLVANCGGNIALDWRMGDCDVFSTEGMNDGTDPYWMRFPEGRSGRNPKPIPNESWRYPFNSAQWGNYTDWKEWTRVLVSMICEGNICNLDHSYSKSNGTYDLHAPMGAWLNPRLESLKGTQPGPFTGEAWGYSVYRERTIFLHLLSNPRGKSGLNGAQQLVLDPFEYEVQTVRVVPTGTHVPYALQGRQLTLDLSGIAIDEVDTIIEIETRNPVPGKVVFQSGNAPGLGYAGAEDVGIIDNNADERAEAETIDVGRGAGPWGAMTPRRILLRFDLHALEPRADDILAAQLELTVARGAGIPASAAGMLQLDAPTYVNARWSEASSWDWIDGAAGMTLWPDQLVRPSNQPPAPQAGAGVGLCAPVSIGSDLADGTLITLPLSAAGIARLKDWARSGENEGFVAIMPQGWVSFYSAEAPDVAHRPRLVVTALPSTSARRWTAW
jgi:hypothetical protein